MLVALAILAGTILIVPFATVPVAQADPATGPGVVSSTTAGATLNGNVPDGTCAARINALGGAGASSAAIGATGGRGAAGASINATFGVLPMQAYAASVGGGGQIALTGGAGGGGTGANAPTDHDGAGGGGRTVVGIAGTNVVVAGGGGGAGAAHNNTPAGNAGAAGFSLSGPGVAIGTSGSAGVDTAGVAGGGQGGQAVAGGTGGVHTVDVARNGTAGGGTATGTGGNGGSDLNYDGAGGGGAGYTGGGGGASTTGQSVSGAGGGGGSSSVAATSPVVAATAPTAVSGAAGVQPALGAAGANGSVNVDWIPCLYNLTLTKTPSVATVNAGGRITWTISVTNSGPDPMTRGDTLTILDTLPSGSNATSPSPNNVVSSIGVTGGSNTNLASGSVTCTGLTVGSAMPASTTCTRPYSSAAGTPGGVVSGGTRGLNVGETLTITYDQYISNTAACGSITNTAAVVDRPTLNTSTATDHIGNQVTDTAAGTVTISCYDLGITKSVSPTPTVVQGGTVTWTVTVVNNGPGNMVGPNATAANPLIVTDTFPTVGVGTPTLTSSVGSAGTCTFTSPTVTCTGSLNSGQQQVLTFTQTVNAGATVGSTIANTASVSDPRTGDTNDSSTASTQVAAAPRIVLQKSLGGQNRFNNADQFVMTVTGAGGSSATTAGTGSTITGGNVTVATGVPAAIYTLSETMAAGSASTLGQYANAIACTNAFVGSTTVLPAGTGTSFTLTPQVSDNVTCTFTNTPRPATVTVAKMSLGGTGGFNFAMTNLASATTTVTTSTAGTPASSSAFAVTALNTAVQITETVPSGWRITGATCSDANSAVTGNNGTFGSLAGNAITIPAAFLEPAANITCTFTDQKLARLVVQKTANGGGGTFGYSTTGGLTPSTFNLSPNPPTTPSVTQVFSDLIPGTFTVTEGANAVFQLTDLTCVAAGTSAPGSTVTTNLATRTVSASLVAGADYTCTYTNVRDAQVNVAKTSVGGDDTFTFTTTGSGNPTDPTPSITTTSGVGSSTFPVPFPTGVSTRSVTITENAPPAGWVMTGIACTNAGGTSIGTVNVPSRSVTITAAPGDVLNCNFTNARQARVTIRKQSIGTTGTFNFTGGTNGLPASLSLDTAAANPVSSTVYQLTAFNTATSITEAIPTNYTLTSATCVDGSGTPVSTSLTGGALTIAAAAVVGGADLTCTFVNTRQNAQVRVDKRWLGATVGDQVTISSTGGSNNPGLVSVANSANEVDAGTAVTVHAGQTLNFSEVFNVGTAANYNTSLACTGASDTDPNDGLTIAAADNGANIVCTYTNSRIPNAVKTAGAVSGPTPAGIYTVTYTVALANPGAATTYGALTDTAAFAPNLAVTGASWTANSTSGAAPASGSVVGSGPFTLAPAAQAIAAGATHTFNVSVTFRFNTYAAVSACAGPGSGLFNSIILATPELQTSDNSACVAPPAPPVPSISIVKSANPTTVTAPGETINYSFLVTNTGNLGLSSVAVTDPLAGLSAISCPVNTLAPGATTTCTATHSTTQADIDAGAIVNTASVIGTAPNGSTVASSDGETVTATRTPSITIDKTASPTTVNAANQIVNYSFVVTNTGNVTLTSVGVNDPLPGLGTITCPANTLAPGISTACTASYTVTQADVDAGTIINTATATGTPPAGAGGPVTASDGATVVATRTPSIDLQKTSNPSTVGSAGQTINYSFLVTNTGNVTLSSIGITDPLPNLGTITCPSTTLAAGLSTTCTATYITTQTDINAGAIANTATVSGTPPIGSGGPVGDSDPNTVTVTQTPAIDIQKSANPTTVTTDGHVVNYSFVVTNTGNVTLTGVAVVDPLPGLGAVVCPANTLAPGASTTCTATYTVTQTDVNAGTISNTATAQGLPPVGPIVTDTDSETVTATRTPSIDIVKTANPTTVSAASQTVNYSFVVTNTGNVTLTGIAVNDPLPGLSGVNCPAATLAPGAATTCTATYSATQADIDTGFVNNSATVTGTPPPGAGPAVSDTDTETVTAAAGPALTVVKSASPATVTTAGQTIIYSFLITNVGNVTLTGVGVSDPLPLLSPVVCPVNVLVPGTSTTCTATYTATQADIDNGSIDNTATTSGTPPTGPAVSASDAETVLAAPNPSLTLVKSATPNNVIAVGQVVNYSFLVTNTGNVTLTGIAIIDPLPGLSGPNCPTTTLLPGVATTCTATRAATQADVDAGSISNTATASGAPPVGAPVTDTDTETVTVAVAPAIQLVKTASPTTVTSVGEVVNYRFLVTNTGNSTLTGIAVTDPLPGLSPVVCAVTTMSPGGSTTCTATYTVTQADLDAGSIENSASVAGTPPNGPVVTDTDHASVVADPTGGIALAKSASPTMVAGAGTVVAYTFVVANTGNATLTDVGITDPLPGISAITCPSTMIPPGSQITCTANFVVTQAVADVGGLTNTAIATGIPGAGIPITAIDAAAIIVPPHPAISLAKSASPSSVVAAGALVTFTLVAVNTGNVTLTDVVMSDTMPGLGPITCPDFGGSLAPGASVSCTATYMATAADVAAGTIHNSATVAANGINGGAEVTSFGDVSVAVAQSPSINLVKTVSTASASNGATVTYSFVVTNTGNTVLTDVTITDPLPGISAVSCPGFDDALDPNETISCTATYLVRTSAATGGRITNTAHVSGRGPNGTVLTDQATAVLTVTGGSSLPDTGTDVAGLIAIAAACLMLGWVLVVSSRPRRRSE